MRGSGGRPAEGAQAAAFIGFGPWLCAWLS